YTGSCHCGAVIFAYYTDRVPAEWSIRACQCSFCRAHAALSTSDPAGQVEFAETKSGAMQRYRFAQRITDFLLCRECGVYVGAVIRTPTGHFGIINVNALRPIPAELAAAAPMNYASEAPGQRATRREERWTPVPERADQPPPEDL
ncbi:MAG: hypothetical protein ABI379_07280, partial [Rhodanobacter sp.]